MDVIEINALQEILVPIFICAVMPVSIVALVIWSKVHNTNKRAEVLIKARESGSNLNADLLTEALQAKKQSPKDTIQRYLLRGCIATFLGIAALLTVLVEAVYHLPEPLIFISSAVGFVLLGIGAAYLLVYKVANKKQKDVNHNSQDPASGE